MIKTHILYSLCMLAITGCSQAESNNKVAPQSLWLATAVGRVDSATESRQLVASVDGVIEQLLVERGQQVKQGQAMLRVACAPRMAAIDTNRAAVRKANASARTVKSGARSEAIMAAQSNVEAANSRTQDVQQRLDQATHLVDSGFISKREVEARTHARDGATAELRIAQAQLAELKNGARSSEIITANAEADIAQGSVQMAQAQAEQCILRSPISGQVLQVLRREGEFSGASLGAPLIIVGDMSQLIVRAEINERDAGLIEAGQSAEIWIDGQAKRWPGKITHMANVMGRRSARSLDPTDRFDRDVREAFISFTGENPPALVGLRVTVGIKR